MPEICIPMGYGSGPYAVMAYGGGYNFCNTDAEDQELDTPTSNVRDLCIVRC